MTDLTENRNRMNIAVHFNVCHAIYSTFGYLPFNGHIGHLTFDVTQFSSVKVESPLQPWKSARQRSVDTWSTLVISHYYFISIALKYVFVGYLGAVLNGPFSLSLSFCSYYLSEEIIINMTEVTETSFEGQDLKWKTSFCWRKLCLLSQTLWSWMTYKNKFTYGLLKYETKKTLFGWAFEPVTLKRHMQPVKRGQK